MTPRFTTNSVSNKTFIIAVNVELFSTKKSKIRLNVHFSVRYVKHSPGYFSGGGCYSNHDLN